MKNHKEITIFFAIGLLFFCTNFVLSQEIPLRNNMYYHLKKRQNEAKGLIKDGKKLIKQGENKHDSELITKGTIKLEIGKKQLKLLEEEAKKNKEEDVKSVR